MKMKKIIYIYTFARTCKYLIMVRILEIYDPFLYYEIDKTGSQGIRKLEEGRKERGKEERKEGRERDLQNGNMPGYFK